MPSNEGVLSADILLRSRVLKRQVYEASDGFGRWVNGITKTVCRSNSETGIWKSLVMVAGRLMQVKLGSLWRFSLSLGLGLELPVFSCFETVT